MKELQCYDSYAYKIMCIMDMLTGMDNKWKLRFDGSEDMFEELKGLILEHEKWDVEKQPDMSWYDSVHKFLKLKEIFEN